MTFYYWKYKNDAQAAIKICAVDNEGDVAERFFERSYLSLKLLISTLKIMNARLGFLPKMKIKLK